MTESGVYNIQAMDRGVVDDDQHYGLWMLRGDDKEYWIEFRQGEWGNEWSEDGAVIYWKGVFPDPTENDGSTIETDALLDMTPGSANGIDDSPLLIGKTFSDSEAGIHITPVAKHETFPESVDIVVNVGQFPDNRPPACRSMPHVRRCLWVKPSTSVT